MSLVSSKSSPHKPFKILCCITYFLLLVLLSSCNTLQLADLGIENNTDGLSSAEVLFLNGNFEEAKKEYEYILATESTSQLRQPALYGFACTQIMLAKNDRQLLAAISNLQKWDAIKGSDPFIENHHMLVLALKQQGNLIRKKNKIQQLQNKNKNILIKSQKKKIAQMAKTVNNLQNQIEELEQIDQMFQEKRKPL